MTKAEINKLTNGMFKDKSYYMPNVDWMDEQEFDANGMPIPMSDRQIATEEIPKSMPVPMSDADVYEAADIAQKIKAEWLQSAKNYTSSNGMLNSKRELRPEEKQNQNIEVASPEKPGWMMAEGTNFWSVNTDDPYWDTEEGYQEALDLYGTSPAWSSRPMEQENQFVSFEPSQRMSL